MKKIVLLALALFFCFSLVTGSFAAERGFLAGFGFGGGAGGVKIAYNLPGIKVDLSPEVGFGYGNNYSVSTIGISMVFPTTQFSVGAGVLLASYSTPATDILGLSGIVDSGTKIGGGISFATNIGNVKAQIGYNSALGLTLGALYKF